MHPRLSEPRRGRGRALRGARRQVHGRRRAGLFRLAPGARGRGRARRPCGACDRRGGGRAARRRTARRSLPGSASPPASWWSAISSARGRPGSEAVVGETPNLAARLQALAEPGSVVIAERTRRLLGGLFELEDLGRSALKGFAGPVRAFRVLGEGAAEDRFEALRGAPCPLVGREHELALLLDRWERAKDGEGQVVLLVGRARHRQVAPRPRAARAAGRSSPHAPQLTSARPFTQTAPSTR